MAAAIQEIEKQEREGGMDLPKGEGAKILLCRTHLFQHPLWLS